MYQNDEPTLHDLLGRNKLVERIGQEISTCDAPQVYGIHGDWGLGKTSFMHALHYYLAGECPESQDCKLGKKPLEEEWDVQQHVRVVWFEAWRYQHEENPVVALLQEIRTQLQWPAKLWNESKKLGEVGLYGALFGMESIAKYIGVKPSEVQKAGENWERKNYATQLPTHVIRGLLENSIRELLPKKSEDETCPAEPRLVVLIDDLDRCESVMAYRLLEGIKIYLSLNNCVFVLGMDQHLIELAVTAHLPKCVKPEATSALSAEYVEKICRCIWHLPLVENPAELLYRMLERTDESLEVANKRELDEVWKLSDSGRAARARAVANVVRIYQCLPPNPRKIKAYAEVLRRFLDHVSDNDETLETFEVYTWSNERVELGAALVVAMSILYHFHRRLYRILEAEPAFFQVIVDWARKDPKKVDSEKGADGKKERHFESLERSHVLDSIANKRTSSEEGQWVSNFSDPMRGDIMRIGELLSDLGDTPESDVRKFVLKYSESQS